MVLSNDDLAEIMDTSDEWIQTRTGIGQRHIATKETTVTLAVKAAKRAMEMAGITGDEIDLIIATTVTPRISSTLAVSIKKRIFILLK